MTARMAMFPGQGAQFVGMANELIAASEEARQAVAEASEIVGYDLGAVMSAGPEDRLMRTDISQPAILVHSWLAWQSWREKNAEVSFAAAGGLSLGEYSALLAAGVFTFADAVRLVHLRGQAMQDAAEAQAGGMVALTGADEAQAQALCDVAAEGDVLVVANLNSTGQVVISGDQQACERAAAIAKDHGIRRATPLAVAGAFHSPHMAPAADRLSAALAETPFAAPTIPVYANVSASPISDPDAIRASLVQQLTSPVRWAESMLAAADDFSITEFYEFGPGKVLGGMVKRTVSRDAITQAIDAPEAE